MLCWLNNKGPQPRTKYTIRHTTASAKAMIKEIRYKLDINSLHRNEEDKTIKANDICRAQIRTTRPLLVDSYKKNRNTGSIILVDEGTNVTVAAGMII